MKCPRCRSEVSSDSIFCHQCGCRLSAGRAENIDGYTRDFSVDPPFFSPGESVGERYRIIEEIGRGGMGRVYKAEDRELNTVVALKMIRPELMTDGRVIDRFKKEILLAREITQENVLRIYDYGEIKGIKFISMQYIDGKSLKELIQEQGPFPIEQVKDIAIKICRGLLAAHQQGVVHRDLKPHNILVDKEGHVFIADFGLAKSLDRESLDRSALIIGTPQYIAPEQWRGEEVDKRADIYSLGIIIYEMITGKPLFVSDSELGYYHKHQTEKPTFPRDLATPLPPYMQNIILKCLEKEKIYRYQDAGEIISDLVSSSFSRRPLISSVKKNRIPAKVLTLLLLILALYGLYRLVLRPGDTASLRDEVPGRSVAVLHFKNLFNDLSTDHLRFALADLLATDLMQSKFLQVLPEENLIAILVGEKTREDGLYPADVLQRVALKGNVHYFILGSFGKIGEKLRITIKIMDRQGQKVIQTAQEDVGMVQIFSAIDRLTRKIKRALRFSREELIKDIDQDVDAITTSSTEALRLYTEGKQRVIAEEYDAGLELFKQAIEKDPDFALAYKEIGQVYAHLQKQEKRGEYLKLALDKARHLPIREKLLIEGRYYMEYETGFPRAEQTYRELLRFYPDNREALYQLGCQLVNMEDWDQGIGYLQRAIEDDNPDQEPYAFLSLAYMGKGMYEQARQVIDAYQENFSENNLLKIYKYSTYLFERKFDLADREYHNLGEPNNVELISLQPDGDIAFYRGDLKKAEEEYTREAEKEGRASHLAGIKKLVFLFLVQGKFSRAIELLEEEIAMQESFSASTAARFTLIHLYLRVNKPGKALAEIDRIRPFCLEKKGTFPYLFRRALFFEILANLDLGKTTNLAARLQEFKESVNMSIYKKERRNYYYLLGKIARRDQDFPQAIIHLKEALALLPSQCRGDDYRNRHALFMYELALAYLESGDWDGALRTFEEITGLTIGRYYFGDLYARSFYYLGKIYQEKGLGGKAVENYRQFLDLWVGADAGLLEKTDAKRRSLLLLAQ